MVPRQCRGERVRYSIAHVLGPLKCAIAVTGGRRRPAPRKSGSCRPQTGTPSPHPSLKRPTLVHAHRSTQILPFAACKTVQSPHVHFPPTPVIVSSTFDAHSPQTYDRRPIITSPSEGIFSAEQPKLEFEVERTERGRSPYPKVKEEDVKGSYFHPRAYEACEPENLSLEDEVEDPFLTPPLLVRDSSPSSTSSDDEANDSDEVITPPDPNLAAAVAYPHAMHPNLTFRESFCVEGDNKHKRTIHVAQKPLHAGVRNPPLRRLAKEPFVLTTSVMSPTGQEGCLGGF